LVQLKNQIDMENFEKLRDDVRGSVFNLVNHEDDYELAEESVDEIMETFREYLKNNDVKFKTE